MFQSPKKEKLPLVCVPLRPSLLHFFGQKGAVFGVETLFILSNGS